jgi:hypothetical protein
MHGIVLFFLQDEIYKPVSSFYTVQLICFQVVGLNLSWKVFLVHSHFHVLLTKKYSQHTLLAISFSTFLCRCILRWPLQLFILKLNSQEFSKSFDPIPLRILFVRSPSYVCRCSTKVATANIRWRSRVVVDPKRPLIVENGTMLLVRA